MTGDEDAPDVEYVRRKAKIQLGDGPDQRGEVTVELVREVEERPQTDASLDGSFADWQQEVDRSTKVLRDELGLDEDDD